MDILKVSSGSSPGMVAGAIANSVRNSEHTEMQAIGPRAVNQAVKAIAIARGYLATSGIDLYFVPGFSSIFVGEQERTAIRFKIGTRHPLFRTGGREE